MMAVIEIASKQYKVEEGQELTVEKLDVKEGESLTFDKVLVFNDDKETLVGNPYVSGKKVTAKVKTHGRNKKVWGIKHKAKKRYKMKFGHKQPNTTIQIEKIA
jgi:large subunit ribosomal protein L21